MKHFLRFLAGGGFYFLVELVWRYFMQHGTPHFLMVPMGGLVFMLLMLLEDRRVFPLLSALLGALTVVSLELSVGSVLLFGFGKRYWHYGRINFNGIIALDWSFIWWGLCFGLILARRLILRYLAHRKEKREE